MIDLFVPDAEDPGYMTGEYIRHNNRSWLITGIRCNANGVWLTLK